MTSAQIRQSFLDFFREKKHTIVPSSSLLPDAPNLLFTNAGMNQFVPIFLGQQKPPWKPARVVDTQKCIRAGGKHNDLEDVGLDTYHHTFFEMLGNWSFGDYFKKEAIGWAWELLVERWKFPAQRLYATVYKPGPGEPSEFDQEAYDHWVHLFREADLDPKIHVLDGGKADNFWMMGDTGPCGPCSEVHVDLTLDGDTRGALVNKNDPRCIEIWNLVFIQFNAQPVAGGGHPGRIEYVPLAARHVDTGMGFERVTAIIQGTENLTDFSGTISNYETDVFRPIFDELEKLSGKKYASTLPIVGQAHRLPDEGEGSRSGRPTTDAEQEKIDVAFRVIADHIRALSFAIADRIIPSNEGRGYVLRRILRRAVRYGRSLGFHEPFFFKLVDVVAKTMGDVFPEIRAKQTTIKETIRREEEAFNKTLDMGMTLFEEAVEMVESLESLDSDWSGAAQIGASKLPPERNWKDREKVGAFKRTKAGKVLKEIAGGVAFKLYDTYGFPLDLTELLARERGFAVDVAGFEKLMEEQRERGRKAQKKEEIIAAGELKLAPTKFLGYDFLETEAVVETVLPGTKPDEVNVVLDQTPFYAEMGGQVGDRGLLHVPGHDRTEVGQLRVIDTQKRGDVFVHRASLLEGRAPEPGEAVRVSVDADRRRAIQGHHTVTHLLHWALHEVVSRDASQKGSYVGPDKLTFDFSSAPLTKQQVRDVEKLVNEKIAENAPVSWTEIPYGEAKQRKDIIQFFGEKYGDSVRVLQIGGAPHALNGYSMELCGGTHVRSTSEIGPFRITKEEAIAAGIRRIEAVAGDAARNWAKQEAARQQEKFEALVRKKSDISPLPGFENDAATSEMLQQIDARSAHLERIEVEVRDWEKQSAKAAEAGLRSRAAQIADHLAASHAGENFCVAEVQDGDGKLLQAVADTLKSKFSGPIFLAGATNGSVALVASVPKQMTSKFQANKLIQQIAPIVGGKGGGRPENAQGA
ncbi:MAG TPA: alanine--tRNA ligase, partial [Candidatus Udaeobacter sp.]|nr:alanine--tRNA ligase [Candidatus Udaeobacter sp.]